MHAGMLIYRSLLITCKLFLGRVKPCLILIDFTPALINSSVKAEASNPVASNRFASNLPDTEIHGITAVMVLAAAILSL
jgi:hypothetical protein